MGIAQLGLLVLSIGLSWWSGKQLAKKNKNLVQDDKPTALATRGSFVPRLIGRRRVGYIFGWVGDRARKRETQSKKGGQAATAAIGSAISKGYKYITKTKVKVWRESGWHLLAVGPGTALYEIEQNGDIIFSGHLTPASHPSGSTVDLGSEGSFRVFWGENDQPVNAFLGAASRVGVSSRWPWMFYIEWVSKRLGTTPVWPLITYDIEVAPAETHLSNTPAYMVPSFTLDGPIEDVLEITNGSAGTGKITLSGDVSAAFVTNGRVRLTNNTGLPDTDYDVLKVLTRLEAGSPRTDVYPTVTLSGGTDDGELQANDSGEDDGYNPAHILADLWFSEWPHGIKQATSLFDMASLETLGTLAVTEDLKFSIVAKEGQHLQEAMGTFHQDLSMLLPINFITGKLQFVPVRAPTGPVPNLTDDVQVALPEIETLHGVRPVDRLLFSFADRRNKFREMTIGLDDAGQATQQEFFRARVVQITSTVNFATANVIAERRSQEELSGGSSMNIKSNRGARALLPGKQITVVGVDEVLLVASVTVDALSGEVSLQCIPDFLASTKSEFLQLQAPIVDQPQVEPDPQFQLMEVPEWLSGQVQTLVILRLRNHLAIDGSYVHISRDDATFEVQGFDDSIMQGGTLTDALPADALHELDQGPAFTALGPDVASVLDLSSDEINWRRGRQLAIIGSEIFYLKTITSLGGDQYRLDGLIRARFDTRVESHAPGAEVYIMQDDDGLPIDDLLLEPEVTIYGKAQASGQGLVNLAVVPSENILLYGKGVRPVPVSEVRFDTLLEVAGVSQFSWVGAGSTDIPITWGYFTPRSAGTGAGFAGAGAPQLAATPEGAFLVEILDSGDALKRSVTVTTNAYEYTETDRLADFSAAEPATFKVRVTQLRSGLSSDTTTQTFTKI